MIQRFQIEDIIVQDSSGVVFRALDTHTGKPVALRRFFPFGAGGGGLDAEEQAAYQIAVERLAAVKHPALRSIIAGGCDDVDGIPYIATEWIEGRRLGSIIAEGPLSVAGATELLERAIDVCQRLSDVLGEEAVWVETDLKAIVFSEDTARGATFWISPLKWLGAREDRRGLDPLVALLENVMDWHGKVVTSREGRNLGIWLRWLRGAAGNESLAEAASRLEKTKQPPSPDEEEPQKTTGSRRRSGMIAFLCTGLVLGTLACLGWIQSQANVPEKSMEAIPSKEPDPLSDGNNVFSAADHDLLIAHAGREVSLQGIFEGIGHSHSGKTLYIQFSKVPGKADPRGAVVLAKAPPGLTEDSLSPLLGKNIRIRGKIRIDTFSNLQRPLVMIENRAAIEVMK